MFEGNAYMSQINHLLKDKTFKTSLDAIDFLRTKSVTYNNYKILYELFTDNKYQSKLVDMGIKKSTVNKYEKIVKRIWSKIVNHSYHILKDHIMYNNIKENCLVRLTKNPLKFYKK